ncbi:MAG: transposase [Ktedonobacteraceae bacterium]
MIWRHLALIGRSTSHLPSRQSECEVNSTDRSDQHGHPKIAIHFDLHDCRNCPAYALCTRSATTPRILAVRTQAECETRQLQQTEAFQARYAQRSGIEGTPFARSSFSWFAGMTHVYTDENGLIAQRIMVRSYRVFSVLTLPSSSRQRLLLCSSFSFLISPIRV